MLVDGLNGYTGFPMPGSLNSTAGEKKQANDPTPPKSETVEQGKPVSNTGGSLLGSVRLDLYYANEESLTRDFTSQNDTGYQSIHQEYQRRYEAGLSLDFSFLAKIDGAAEKLANLDQSVFNEWSAEAADLFSMSEKDFTEFVNATDGLFNELESALGMGPEGLDQVAGFFTSQVKSFLSDVKANQEYNEKNRLGEGKDAGLGIPAIAERIKENIPKDLEAFLRDLLEKMGGDAPELPSGGISFTSMKDLLKEILNMLREDNFLNDEPDQIPEKAKDRGEQGYSKPMANTTNEMQYSFAAQRTTTISALFEYNMTAQNPSNDYGMGDKVSIAV